MDQLHDSLDKLFTEVHMLDQVTDTDELSDEKVRLALSIAKRARREIGNVVRSLAARRDGQ
jgi:riboflavin synthase